MSAPIDPKIWNDAKDAYVNGTDSLAAIAMRFGISKRAVEKRASDEGWAALRKVGAPSNGELNFSRERQGQPSKPTRTTTPLPSCPRRPPQEMDEVEIINEAIASLSAILSGSMEDTRGIGGIATGLCRLIELRNKLVPKTAADLADMAMSLGISPQEFIRALNDQCQKKA